VPAFASTTAPPIVVWGSDNVARTMAYTAFNNNGQVEKNPDFEITQNNVVSIVSNGKLTLLSTNGLAFSNAQITDANQKTTDVPIVNNQVTFTTPGVFTFTVVSGQYAYTCIVVVGEQTKQNIDKQISKTYVIIDIIIEDDPYFCERYPKDPSCIDDPTPPPPTCPVLEKDGKTCSPLPDPGGVTPPPSPKPDPLYGGDSFFNGPSPEPAPEEGDTENGEDAESNGEDSTDGESAEDGGSSDEGSSEEGDDGGNSRGETEGDSFFG
jgi:hypothetical protein